MQRQLLTLICFTASLMTAVENAASAPPKSTKGALASDTVIQVDPDWDLLLPADQRSSPQATPAPLHGYLGESAPAAQQTGSGAVNPRLNGRMVRIPGFIVPLEEDSDGRVTEFFLVPYVGACIHVPPPPPNQIIYVTAGEPFFVHGLGDAYWIVGRMHAQVRNTRLASASYSMTASSIEPYEYKK